MARAGTAGSGCVRQRHWCNQAAKQHAVLPPVSRYTHYRTDSISCLTPHGPEGNSTQFTAQMNLSKVCYVLERLTVFEAGVLDGEVGGHRPALLGVQLHGHNVVLNGPVQVITALDQHLQHTHTHTDTVLTEGVNTTKRG